MNRDLERFVAKDDDFEGEVDHLTVVDSSILSRVTPVKSLVYYGEGRIPGLANLLCRLEKFEGEIHELDEPIFCEALAQTKTLCHLMVLETDKTFFENLIKALNKNTSVRTLCFDKLYDDLNGLRHEHLTSLTINDSELDDVSGLVTFLKVNRTLKILDLTMTAMNPADVLEALCDHPTLEVLRLSRCKVGHKACTMLIKLVKENRTLKHLDLPVTPDEYKPEGGSGVVTIYKPKKSVFYKAFAESLASNDTLEHLGLDESLEPDLAGVLKTRNRLKSLRLRRGGRLDLGEHRLTHLRISKCDDVDLKLFRNLKSLALDHNFRSINLPPTVKYLACRVNRDSIRDLSHVMENNTSVEALYLWVDERVTLDFLSKNKTIKCLRLKGQTSVIPNDHSLLHVITYDQGNVPFGVPVNDTLTWCNTFTSPKMEDNTKTWIEARFNVVHKYLDRDCSRLVVEYIDCVGRRPAIRSVAQYGRGDIYGYVD